MQPNAHRDLTVRSAQRLQGTFRPPSDKSLTHRAYLLAAIAKGKSHINSPLLADDCHRTLLCLQQLGVKHTWTGATTVQIEPPEAWSQPTSELDCGNSGTTMRLLAGLIASRDLDVTMVGDASLSKRPMRRIAEPLELMGAMIEGETPPLHLKGSTALQGIDYKTTVASAQIKSCVLLAGLQAEGETWVTEPARSRDHTERMLRATGVDVLGKNLKVGVKGGSQPEAFEYFVPGDLSSAAFFMVGAALLPGSKLNIFEVLLNPTRAGILSVFRQVGIRPFLAESSILMGEPVSDLQIRHEPDLKPFQIEKSLVPRLIDEIPILAVLATQCNGVSTIRDAAELRVKESDRIECMANGLRAMGAKVETFEDGMAIEGPTQLHGAAIEAANDHRIAMAFAIAGLIASGETVILGAEAIETSYPAFQANLARLTVE